MEVYWITWTKRDCIVWYQWKVSKVSEEKLHAARATCASGKQIEIFAQHDNE